MTYMDWKHDFEPVAQGVPERYAQLWNLEHETRINKQRGLFKRRIGHLHQHRQHASASPQQTAVDAFVEAIDETKPVNSKWLGCLETTNAPPIPNMVVTYERLFTLVRYGYVEIPEELDRPLNPIRLKRPLKTETDARGECIPIRRFIWISFLTDNRSSLPQDPTTVKREMGLAHYEEGDFIYQFQLKVDSTQRCFIPTCLDAELRPAWKPPPDGFEQPWGLTRDLTDGQSRWPELLVETKDYLHQDPPQGELVSPPNQAVAIGSVQLDYKVSR